MAVGFGLIVRPQFRSSDEPASGNDSAKSDRFALARVANHRHRRRDALAFHYGGGTGNPVAAQQAGRQFSASTYG
ncbi:MAG: hypothetical protein WD229_13065 [Pirellulales bacterium]